MNNKCFSLCFDLYTTKVNYRNSQSKNDDNNLFDQLISEQSEIIYKIEGKDTILLKTSSIILDHKINQDYDEKYLYTKLDTNTKIGDIFFWERTNTHWIVYAQYLTEKNYYKSIIKRANWCISWIDKYSNVQFQWVYVRGPLETKLNQINKDNNIIDVHNETLSILMPKNSKTISFKKYDNILLNGKKWKIVADIDDISNTELIEIQLQKTETDYNDDIENNLVDGLLDTNYEFTQLFSNQFYINQTLDLNKNIILYKNNEIIESDFSIKMIEGKATIKKSNITFPKAGNYIFEIIYNKNPNIKKQFSIEAIDSNEDLFTYKIIGNKTVKCLFEYQYYVQNNELSNIKWEIKDDKNIVNNFNIDNNIINIKFGIKTGSIILNLFIEDKLVDSMNIEVIGTYE